MDGYVIRKGEPLDWFKYEDGTPVKCEAGTDLWVTRDKKRTRHVQPLALMDGESALVIGHESGKAIVWPRDLKLFSKPAFDFAPLTYTPAPFSHTVKADEKVRISPEQLDEWVQETYRRPRQP